MDVLAVLKAGAAAIAESRQGHGPVLLECKTYRFVGHSRSDVNGYRTRDEEAQWRQRDPITQLGGALLLAGRAAQADLDRAEVEVTAELDDAVAFAESSPDATEAQAVEGVYA
jgi:TPP-dependent pyruvate/acetoin dehydrogenase alpha subunit